MEILPNIPHNHVVIVIIQLKAIFCAVIKQGIHKKYSVIRIHTASHPTLIASSGVLLNSAWIGAQIRTVLKTYTPNNSAITIICDDHIIPQGYTATLEASSHQYLSKNLAVPHHTLHTMYLCPREDRFLSWWSRMPYALLLQIQLIAYTYTLNIISINARLPVLIAAYKLMYGANFRPLQLATDLQRTGYDIAEIIQPTIIHQFSELPSHTDSIPDHIYTTILGAITYEMDAAW